MRKRTFVTAVTIIFATALCIGAEGGDAQHQSASNDTRIADGMWDYSMVTSLVSQLYPFDPQSSVDRENAASLVESFNAAKVEPSCTSTEALRWMCTIRYGDFAHVASAGGVIERTTNAAATEVLLWSFTNYHSVALGMPMENGEYSSTGHFAMSGMSSSSLSGLRHIGTPDAMDRVNHVLRQLCNEGRSIFEPDETIDPDTYPKEAADWLLNYPEDKVRMSMAHRWLKSSRPETPELIRKHIKWVKGLSKTHSAWYNSYDGSYKAAMVESMEQQLKEYQVRYRRWEEDGKRLNINSGEYRDEYWDEYRKEREAQRTREQVKKPDQTNAVVHPIPGVR